MRGPSKSPIPVPSCLRAGRELRSQQEADARAVAVIGEKLARKAFDVFLCYNRDDQKQVQSIAEILIQRGMLPWFDRWQNRPGIPWQTLLEASIQSIPGAAVFVGNSGVGPWQSQEIQSYLREFVRRGAPVIPVLLEGVQAELPLFLGNHTWVDFTIDNPDPIDQLIWGITGDRE